MVTAVALIGLGVGHALAAAAGAPLHASAIAATVVGCGVTAAVLWRFVVRAPVALGDLRRSGGYAAAAGVGLALFGSGALGLLYALAPPLRPALDARGALLEGLLAVGQPSMIPWVAAAVVVSPAVFEEFLFRGVLRTWLGGLSTNMRVFGIGALFALLHVDPFGLVPLFYVLAYVVPEPSPGALGSAALLATGTALATWAVGRVADGRGEVVS